MRRYIFLLISFIIVSCESETHIPMRYNGYAILQIEKLPDDGVYDYTFYPFLKQKFETINDEFDVSIIFPDKGITFVFPPNSNFLEYGIELKEKGWNREDYLILVKVNYEIVNDDWMTYIDIKPKLISYDGKEFDVEDYNFYSLSDKKGKQLYYINNLEFLKKIYPDNSDL